MTIFEFNTLDLETRGETIWEYGKLIGEQQTSKNQIILFSIFNFHVEMHFSDDNEEVVNIIGVSTRNF